MAHIDQIEEILESITAYNITQSDIQTGYEGLFLMPSNVFNTLQFEEVEYYDLFILDASLSALELKKTALLKCKNNRSFVPADWVNCGYISVADGTLFDDDDAVEGGTSHATGTVYKIVGNTLYLKNVTGTWQNAEVITDSVDSTSTTTSTLMPIAFPFFMDCRLIKYYYPTVFNASVGAEFLTIIRFEARWSL